jgi:hypothetical protein
MSAKPVFRGQCIVISLLFAACPLYLPEKVQIKTEPAIYLPLGSPDSLQEKMNLPLNGLATVKPEAGDAAVYDFQGEYGDTRAFIIRITLVEGKPLGAGLPPAPPALPGVTPPDITIDFAKAGISQIKSADNGIELKEIQDILGKYKGLKFRSVPAYLYIQGPARIFENGNVTAAINARPDTELLPKGPVNPCTVPAFPGSKDEPMTWPLLPKPETRFDLKDTLNQENPPKELKFDCEINIENITIKYDELDAVREEFKTPLSAVLVLVLPFQFSAEREIPILSERNDEPDKAIHLLEEGGDLFGRKRAGGESSGAVQDVLERMQSLMIRVNIENNLGLAGYAPVYGARPDPGKPEERPLGRIGLSGSSAIAVPKSKTKYPFNVWVEIYLEKGQNLDIKRQAEDSDVPPLKLSLGVVVKTRINETF